MTVRVNLTRDPDGNIVESVPNPDAEPVKYHSDQGRAIVRNGSAEVTFGPDGANVSTRPIAKASTGDILREKMDANPESILASARHPTSGLAQAPDEVNGESVVTVTDEAGRPMEVKLKVALQRGWVGVDDHGRYMDVRPNAIGDDPAPEPTIEEIERAKFNLPPVVTGVMQVSLEGFSEHEGGELLVALLEGRDINYDALASRTQRAAGELEASLGAATAGLRAHLANQLNIQPERVMELLKLADPSQGRGQLRNALRQSVHGNSQALHRMATKAMQHLPPTAEELHERGLETKPGKPGQLLVKLMEDDGPHWVDVKVARRIGAV